MCFIFWSLHGTAGQQHGCCCLSSTMCLSLMRCTGSWIWRSAWPAPCISGCKTSRMHQCGLCWHQASTAINLMHSMQVRVVSPPVCGQHLSESPCVKPLSARFAIVAQLCFASSMLSSTENHSKLPCDAPTEDGVTLKMTTWLSNKFPENQ